MNKWYNGWIDDTPVAVFVSDDFSVQCDVAEDAPKKILKKCEEIEKLSYSLRSFTGLSRMLSAQGWHNA